MMRKHVMAVMMAAAAMVMAGCSGNNSEASKGAETAKTEAAGLYHWHWTVCRARLFRQLPHRFFTGTGKRGL